MLNYQKEGGYQIYGERLKKLEDEKRGQEIEITDLNPTIQAIIGSGINFNNHGFANKRIINAYIETDET